MTRDDAQREAVFELWRKGRAADWLLDAGQQAWRTAFWGTPPLSSTVWNIGRQRGKTFAAVFINIEAGCTIPDAMLRYCAKTKDSALGIFMPAFDMLVTTMPPELRPSPAGSDKPWRKGLRETEWAFPQGGLLFLFGTDAQSFAKGRGPRSHVITLDEAGFYQDLPDTEAALLPSLQTTGGRALYPSTPAESTGHAYTQRIYAAKASGQYQHDTFWNNPRVNHHAVIEAERKRLGMTLEVFLKSTYFRREFLAEIVTDESRAAMPAWSDELAAKVVGDWVRPEFFDAYQSHDPGMTGDPHASLFGYLNPYDGRLYIEDELELRSAPHSVGGWANEVKKVETKRYGVTAWNGKLLGSADLIQSLGGMESVPEFLRASLSENAPRQPYMRVGDNPGVCRDLTIDHQLAVWPTPKHEKALEVSNTNQLLGLEKVRIHERCVRLIHQLQSTIWNKTRTEWERLDTDHGDLIDDLVYMTRGVSWNRDCRPKHVDSATRAIQAIQDRASGAKTWDDAFRRK